MFDYKHACTIPTWRVYDSLYMCKVQSLENNIYIGGRDFDDVDSTIILLPHESKKDICVTIIEDLLAEESESFYCSLSISQGSDNITQVTVPQAVVTIQDNDSKYKSLHVLW